MGNCLDWSNYHRRNRSRSCALLWNEALRNVTDLEKFLVQWVTSGGTALMLPKGMLITKTVDHCPEAVDTGFDIGLTGCILVGKPNT